MKVFYIFCIAALCHIFVGCGVHDKPRLVYASGMHESVEYIAFFDSMKNCVFLVCFESMPPEIREKSSYSISYMDFEEVVLSIHILDRTTQEFLIQEDRILTSEDEFSSKMEVGLVVSYTVGENGKVGSRALDLATEKYSKIATSALASTFEADEVVIP